MSLKYEPASEPLHISCWGGILPAKNASQICVGLAAISGISSLLDVCNICVWTSLETDIYFLGEVYALRLKPCARSPMHPNP